MEPSFANPSFVNFGKVYVQGHVFTISTAVIEQFLQRPSSQENHEHTTLSQFVITISEIPNAIWHAYPHKFPATSLTGFYALFHQLIINIWIPRTNRFAVTQEPANILHKIRHDHL